MKPIELIHSLSAILLLFLPTRAMKFNRLTAFKQNKRISSFSYRKNFTSKSSNLDDQDIDSRRKICVIGGGFGGLYSALGIAQRTKQFADVYLIDPKERFVFSPLLYELALENANILEVAPKYTDLLSGSKVKMLQGKIQNINFMDKGLQLSNTTSSSDDNVDSSVMKYDDLIIAVGIQPRLDLIPGSKEYSLPFYRLDDALKLKQELKKFMKNKSKVWNIIVIGGGYSGVEVASSIAQTFHENAVKITLVDRNDRIMSTSTTYNRNIAERTLTTHGVTMKVSTSVMKITENAVYIKDRDGNEEELESDLTIMSSGTEQSDFIKQLPVTKDKFGRILINDKLQVLDYPNVYAIGDCSLIAGEMNPATAQVAMQQSGVLVNNVVVKAAKEYLTNMKTSEDPEKRKLKLELSLVTNQPLQSFKYLPLGEMLTLGLTSASMSSLGGLIELEGPLASLTRRLVYGIRMPTPKQSVRAILAAGSVTTGKLFATLFGEKN